MSKDNHSINNVIEFNRFQKTLDPLESFKKWVIAKTKGLLLGQGGHHLPNSHDLAFFKPNKLKLGLELLNRENLNHNKDNPQLSFACSICGEADHNSMSCNKPKQQKAAR